ncbi:AAA family ATPase [Thermogemmata fonticola]|jgi:MoxR-like ATPase|uniref:MoxR family ATPase n=1 Tax=Thermogemmata fonticola TaxID=2755323 RepID=A0A7V8VCT0_9BACT|nr:MoxR family ATPase [Thermogemmata fonticola]MBA2225475.1 MoxR family ATPase [Thermogemmata fonticola]
MNVYSTSEPGGVEPITGRVGSSPVSGADRFTEYLNQFAADRQAMMEQLRRVIVGQTEVIEQVLAAIFTRGHCLLVGVPGLAKTLLVSSIAQILNVTFKRIQFTPDLMPSDITGTMVLEETPEGKREFRFVRGPIFANIVLADEINRTPPKTQAALLEAMQERQVTAGSETMKLPDPFFVIATQNPIEQEGTYPLPEAQLDRFMFNVKVEYPSLEEERLIVSLSTRGDKPELVKVLSAERIIAWQKLVKRIEVPQFVVDYIVRLVRATRPKDPSAPEMIRRLVDWGAGPRAGLFLAQAGQAFAAMDGRPSVAIDDIRKAAIPVLRHRVSANFQAQAEGKSSDDIIAELLKLISEPEPKKYVDKTRR